ncbi:cell envelope-related transcriptional attenuator domain protein [Mycobacterium kansasii]|uniref:Cell envelope-related transcriptional attenuator domain protein n=1 Tax=Mycobacterium kansasii TaxID=1768 RepID=A0A1V3X7M7_MYCKA|nr:cell envelope-related transcriptional attenuator domain protein [Mycobacterium kansasii]
MCLNHAVSDSYSGADFPAGLQRLDAAQALAFVRQRHGLDNGDLDRTHRQQAFLSSVMHDLQDSGTFTNLDRLDSLMAVARKDVVLSAGWDQDLFRRMGELAGGNVEFRTLPVVRYDNIDGQDVNIIDPAAIKAEVAAAIGTGARRRQPRPRPRSRTRPPSSTWSMPAASAGWPARCPARCESTATPPARSGTAKPATPRPAPSNTAPAPKPTRRIWPACSASIR